MKSRILVATAAVAIVLWCVPAPVGADNPSKPMNPSDEPFIGESDPWLPDGRDPGRAMATPPRVSTADDARSGANTTPNLVQRVWLRTMIQMLRTFGLGGALR